MHVKLYVYIYIYIIQLAIYIYVCVYTIDINLKAKIIKIKGVNSESLNFANFTSKFHPFLKLWFSKQLTPRTETKGATYN